MDLHKSSEITVIPARSDSKTTLIDEPPAGFWLELNCSGVSFEHRFINKLA